MKYLTVLTFSLFIHLCLFGQLVLEKDINTEPASADPFYLVSLNGALYFSADDGISGEELWSLNETTGNSSLVSDLNPGDTGSSPEGLLVFGGKIYFNGRDRNGIDKYLMVHDPSNNTTGRVSDKDGNEAKNTFNLTPYNGQLYFQAEHSNNDIELVKYDPVQNTIELVSDINITGSSYPNYLTIINNKLWFIANDGISPSRLWTYDGSTNQIENIIYTVEGAASPSLSAFIHLDGKLYLTGYIQELGNELYVYDMATNALLDIPEIRPGRASSDPNNFAVFNNKIYFSANLASSGRELYTYDIGTKTHSIVSDIFPGNEDSQPTGMISFNNKLYFIANISQYERYLCTYTETEGVVPVATAVNESRPGYLSIISVANNTLYLNATIPATGQELFKYTPGQSTLTLVADINQNTIGSDPYDFTEYKGKLYFGADEVNTGREIWVYNPQSGNVDLLTYNPGTSSPRGFTVVGEFLYFSAVNSIGEYGIQKFDDVTGLITSTSYVTPNSTGGIADMTEYNGKLYFTRTDPIVGSELHVFDPATEMVEIVSDINPNGNSNPGDLIVFNNELYFNARNPNDNGELWKYSSTTNTVSLVVEILAGDQGSYPNDFAIYDNDLYFSAYTPDDSYELYRYDPDTDVTTQVTDIIGNVDPGWLTVYDNKLFFAGRWNSHTGSELMAYDALLDSTYLAAEVNPSGWASPQYLVTFNNQLYFTAETEEYGRELWSYNATDSTASIVADIRMGVTESNPEYLTVFNGKLYLAANDGIRGSEIWSLAECLNVVVDSEPEINNGTAGSISLTVSGGTPPYAYEWGTGATTSSIDNLIAGFYNVKITDATGCIENLTAEVVYDANTSVNVIDDPELKIFPNPSNGVITINFGSLKVNALDIVDIHGRTIHRRLVQNRDNRLNINLTGSNSGVYFLRMFVEDGVALRKIILK